MSGDKKFEQLEKVHAIKKNRKPFIFDAELKKSAQKVKKIIEREEKNVESENEEEIITLNGKKYKAIN